MHDAALHLCTILTSLHLCTTQLYCARYSSKPVHDTALHLCTTQPYTCARYSLTPVHDTALHLCTIQPYTCARYSPAPVHDAGVQLYTYVGVRFQAEREKNERLPCQNSSSQGQNLAVTGLCVLSSLDSLRNAVYRGDLIRTIFMINARAQRNVLHIWITLVIIQQHLVRISRIDGPTEYLL